MRTNLIFIAIALACFEAIGQVDVTIKADANDTNILRTYKLPAGTNQPTASLVLRDTDIGQVLGLYAQFTDRTVLRSPRIQRVSLTIETSATNRTELAHLIEKALAEKEIVTIPDGDKFVMVVPQAEASTVKPRSAEISALPPNSPQRQLIPLGTINFNADVREVAAIYAGLLGGELDRSESTLLYGPQIRLRTQTPLNKEEVLYALETLFQWQGIKLVPTGTNLFRAVSIREK